MRVRRKPEWSMGFWLGRLCVWQGHSSRWGTLEGPGARLQGTEDSYLFWTYRNWDTFWSSKTCECWKFDLDDKKKVFVSIWGPFSHYQNARLRKISKDKTAHLISPKRPTNRELSSWCLWTYYTSCSLWCHPCNNATSCTPRWEDTRKGQSWVL